MSDLHVFLQGLFRPGVVYAFVGAGGKSALIRAAAECCAARGTRVRITTTTRIALDDFPSCPVSVVADAAGFLDALQGPDPVRVIVSAVDTDTKKLMGVEPLFIDAARPDPELLILVEADGSRRRPLKVPTERDPVIPRSTAAVTGIMGASVLGEAITEESCYNHEAALALLGRTTGVFEPRDLALIALHSAGLRKGVLPAMGFHVIVNQADIAEKRAMAREAITAIRDGGAEATLLSCREGRIYGQG